MEAELLNLIKDTSPVIWNIYLKQARVEAISFLVLGLFLVVIWFIIYKLKSSEKINDIDNEILDVLAWIYLIFGPIPVIFYLVFALKWFLNPEFYALRWLLIQIK